MAASMATPGIHGFGLRHKRCSFAYFAPSAVTNVQKHPQPPPQPPRDEKSTEPVSRREIVLRSSGIGVLGAIFHFGGKKPNYLGVQKSPPGLALCPATNNCVSTSENTSDLIHYAPPWNYNPEEGRGSKKPVSREEAMQELLEVIQSTKPDNFAPKIAEKKDDYIRVEYESPILGFVDDVEFWFPPGKKSIVQYRSASRLGNFDFDANKKRIKALRLKLEKKGWASEDRA
ncbi:OLC1v1002307C1 [Oldenlandia corymbosa var. corymbosa]|uniref:OLC1v1002307C1 n=1 Tax=Oldenlandia corymbosa var. corymbosa TaxID=529605 RepID=A0AAV1D7Z9_OLDCO|nr:OLC1v1002307C1 [Oldenlandia corymbosa var. corymbosa]